MKHLSCCSFSSSSTMLSYARRALNFQPYAEIFLSIAEPRSPKISNLTFSGGLSTGLRLVLDQHTSTTDSSLKPNNFATLILQKSVDLPSPPLEKEPCFLSSCQLCKKPLKSGQDIYMYMGDQGYCSVECRSRQIAIDERKEVEEALDRRIMGSDDRDLLECPNGGECQTCSLLKDLRRRRRSSGRRGRK